ncbi:MAG: extracellular solute-binding protein [Firmicutes bacterium]|nr:extracellular solute-binding protein [Bacillota bacterium]MBR5926493.1 extracellular solute-binding protein [Bacillota bacterium]MBR6025545.1 extracellular solute-binding protein [Bacillota bacterium]
MRKLIALALAVVMILGLAACGTTVSKPAETTTTSNQSITLWTYPVGGWGDEATVKALTDAFTAETGIEVTVEYLTYADGDDKVNTALTAGKGPDLILEGPERLVSNWGANGYMVNIADLFDAADKSELNAAALNACFADANTAYEYPLVMTAHCMGINLNAFKEAGADQYINAETHTWTTEQFISAVDALTAKFGSPVGAVFCGGQGGDQGTRALVNNLYGGGFTNAEHTQYTWDDAKNIQALKKLYDLKGIAYDPAIVGGDEIALFYNGTLKMAFCWNIAQQLNPNSAGTGAGKTLAGDDIVFMAFPSEDGTAKLQGGIWGFGIFDNKDEARIEASKKFIQFMCDSEHTIDAVRAANFFPARSTVDAWSDNAIMAEYNKLMPMLGDYYQVTKGWAQARTAWWNMLQQVGQSDGSQAAIETAVAKFCNEANGN